MLFRSGIYRGKFKKVGIAKDSPEGYFIQRLRDEAHRFAITYHKQLRSKKSVKSKLDEILGVGGVTKKKLIKEFGSVSDIIGARTKDIAKVVGEKLAKRIKESL